MKILEIFKLLRPSQWLKNFFIFLPLFFDKQLVNLNSLINCLIAFFAFCFIASSIYCFNDIIDVENDRKHPYKKLRPIASNSISIFSGYIIMLISFVIGILFSILLNHEIFFKVLSILILYYFINILYCLFLKNYAIVDVFIIAFGFILRILVGGFSASIRLSQWIILMTFLLALFLAFAKRRNDVYLFNQTGINLRNHTSNYNVSFLDHTLSIVASITMVCYIMYTVSDDVCKRLNTNYLYFTSIFVLAGIIRYLQITLVENKSGSPTSILLTDRFIQLCILFWIASFIIIIYLI